MNECFIVPCYSAVSGAGPPKVKLGTGMKAISSLALTKCELCKSLESLLLLNSSPSAAFTHTLLGFIILSEHHFECKRSLNLPFPEPEGSKVDSGPFI